MRTVLKFLNERLRESVATIDVLTQRFGADDFSLIIHKGVTPAVESDSVIVAAV